jgi:hydroxyacylglutathione hydrolase
MTNAELLRRFESTNAPTVVDARSGLEFRQGHIKRAIHATVLDSLLKKAPLPRDRDCELVITCEHGPRARMARRLLTFYGYRNLTLLDGHMLRWRTAGLPTEQ